MKFINSYWIRIPLWSAKKIYKISLLGILGVCIIGVVAFTLYMRSLPTLSTWHKTILENEFTLDSNVNTFEAYMGLEEKLFDELETKVYNTLLDTEKNSINRYTKNSLSDPRRWPTNWNKSFELPVNTPKGAVLLLHGMSDSPYSLHHQAKLLHKKGFYVVGLRLPGHGTIPSGLRNLKWQEMAAVVKLGMEHLKNKVGNKPIHIMGYSTGAPLALNYTLNALLEKDSTLTLPTSLIFYSPAIGVSKAAPLAVWQGRIGYFLGLPKLEWNSLLPEFDPYKYGSFAVNAGDQVYRLSKEVQKQFDALETQITQKVFPPVLSFSSILDSTVSVPVTVDKLYNRLPEGKHTLVLFDINHHFSRNHLVKSSVLKNIAKLRDIPTHENYNFELITNEESPNNNLEQIVNHNTPKRLHYSWPKGLYSLSHLAMPMSEDDPLYGNADAPKSPGIELGHLAIYGETGVLQSSPASLLRQRWNPFHNYINERVLDFLDL